MSTEGGYGKIRADLSKIVLDIRPKNIPNGSLDEPELVQEYGYNDSGVFNSRIKIYLRSRGCVSATCTMCPMPHETNYGNVNLQVSSGNYVEQFNSVFRERNINGYDIVCVYNSGNWFANQEVPSEARVKIYKEIGKSKSKSMMVQSLPQFITPKTVEEARENLGDKKLIVGIGLQSADDVVRSVCINTTCTKTQFESAAKLLNNNGYSLETYIMIKPPFLTESETIKDVIGSIKYLESIGQRNISICPTRVSEHTIVAELSKRGLYEPPSLWTVVKILRIVHQEGLRVRVACLDIDGKDTKTIYPKGCTECTPKVLESLKRYSSTGEISELNSLSCKKCEPELEEKIAEVNDTPLIERVNQFVQEYRAEVYKQ